LAAVRDSRAAKRAGRRIPDELMTITIDGDWGKRLRRRPIICVAWCFEGIKRHAPSDEQEQGQEQRQKQIPPLRCGMTNKGGCGVTNKEARANTEILAAPE
jgi:hypothetical protein